MSYTKQGSDVDQRRRAVTIRSILLGALLCILMAWAIAYFDVITRTSELGGCHFPPGPIFLFVLFVLLVNLPVKAIGMLGNLCSGLVLGLGGAMLWARHGEAADWPSRGLLWGAAAAVVLAVLLMLLVGRRPLNARELIVIFSMMLIGSGIPTFGFISMVLPMMTGWQYLATPEAGWNAFFEHIPDWMVVGDPAHMVKAARQNLDFEHVGDTYYVATKWFYEGLPEGQGIPLDQWLKPLLAWSVFIGLLYTLMFCLTSILRKQWVENEKLLFPLMQLPVEIARSEGEPGVIGALFRSRLLIAGVLVPFIAHGAVQLKHYLAEPVAYGASPFRQTFNPLADSSLGAFGPLWVYVYFSIFGFCFLLSTEISLSVWLFWAINRFQGVALDWLGTPEFAAQVGPGRPAQFNGALIAFVLFGLYAARRHLWDVFRKAVLWDRSVDDSGELIGYRASFFGLIIALVGLVAWCTMMGMAWWLAIFVFFLFVITIIGITRAVAECGLLFVKIFTAAPENYVRTLLGTRAVDPRSFTVLGFIQYVSLIDLKTLLMPALMQGCKGRDTVGDRSKKTLVAFVLAVVVVVLVSGVVTMRECYSHGAVNFHDYFYINGPKGMGFDRITQWIGEAKGPDYSGIAYMVGGAVVTGFLIFMRRSFPWWPLHPLGYIVGDGLFESNRVAFSFFIGWMIKATILKFGGGGLFKRLRPFFLGLILGEFGTAGFWIVIGFVVGNHGPMVFP